ncbi:hypothetical protein CCO03_07310 [Comamonas serinivorans]|uniref:IPTL-CTERM protein sorting domain-containing protein n=2 Tax=Comamonas serinivorans TaxID=1082851 RepID=A0A1Y0EME1_9BURK|nr:hypothetical protein CCO03_07310 [Comamonas serinivorans]
MAEHLLKGLMALALVCSAGAVKAQGLLFEPGVVNFPNTVAGSTSSEVTITVTNFDPMPVTVTAIIPPANTAFAVTHDCPVGSYAPFATCQVRVTFTAPMAAGPVNDVFRFQALTYGDLDIRLNGASDGVPLTPQTITFTSTAPAATVGSTYAVTATGGGSGNPVVFSIDPASDAVCTVNGSTVSFIGVGDCTIQANQAGNATFEAAPQVQQVVTVSAAPPAAPKAVPSSTAWGLGLLALGMAAGLVWRRPRA